MAGARSRRAVGEQLARRSCMIDTLAVSPGSPLGGTACEVYDRSLYEAMLRQVVSRWYPDLLARLSAAAPAPPNAAAYDDDAMSRVIGYYGPPLASMIDREWQDDRANEFDESARAYESYGLLDRADRIFLWGAGA